MKQMEIKKAGNYFNKKHQDLHFILTKVRHLNALYERLTHYIEPQIAAYCSVANMVGGKLILVVGNGAIASHLRLIKRELIDKFRSDSLLATIKDFHCKVDPAFREPLALGETQSRKPALLSPETSMMIKAIANSLTDPKLQQVLMNIASRVKE